MATKKKVATKKGKAKRGRKRVNKSQAVRDYLTEHTEAMPKDVVKALRKEKRITVTAQQVSTIKSGMRNGALGRKKKGVKKRGRRAAARTTIGFDALFEAKALADRIGGIDKAKEALSMLEKLT